LKRFKIDEANEHCRMRMMLMRQQDTQTCRSGNAAFARIPLAMRWSRQPERSDGHAEQGSLNVLLLVEQIKDQSEHTTGQGGQEG